MLDIQDHAGGVRELRLARPPVNALNPGLVAALNSELAKALRGHRAVVLSGQSGMFSGGLDVRELSALTDVKVREFLLDFLALQERIACAAVPVIAAITGHSPAGGTVLAVFCDYRIMARGPYRIGLNEVQVGLTPGAIIYRSFERLLGPRLAADWAMRGVLADPETALAAGLVDELAEPAAVIERALAYARELLALPASAFSVTRTQVRADMVALFDLVQRTALVEQTMQLWSNAETRQRLLRLVDKSR